MLAFGWRRVEAFLHSFETVLAEMPEARAHPHRHPLKRYFTQFAKSRCTQPLLDFLKTVTASLQWTPPPSKPRNLNSKPSIPHPQP